MKKLIMCQGLPGSGKSHWALEFAQEHPGTVIVNKDDIRLELEASGWQWSRDNEAAVVTIRDSRIEEALGAGAETVISSDTNFGRKHKTRLNELAVQCGAQFEVKRFDTPVEECIRRDALRLGKARVGEDVIRKMASQYGLTTPAPALAVLPVTLDEQLMPAIICDLDGTLALNNGHRSFYDATTCDRDTVNKPVLETIRAFSRLMYQIIYLSGREDKYREPTMRFLASNHCPQGPLHMRTTGDFRKDYIVKGELFDQHVRGKYNVLFCLDDRNQVVDFWRSIGLTCFQCAPGNF